MIEKKDDISYSLALKITTNFVESVNSKGYLTHDMYNDFISKLAVTGNSYDIKLEHVAKKYYPTIYVYKDDYDEIFKCLLQNGNQYLDAPLLKKHVISTKSPYYEDGILHLYVNRNILEGKEIHETCTIENKCKHTIYFNSTENRDIRNRQSLLTLWRLWRSL